MKTLISIGESRGKTIAHVIMTEEFLAFHFTDGTALIVESHAESGYYGDYSHELRLPRAMDAKSLMHSAGIEFPVLDRLQLVDADDRAWYRNAVDEANARKRLKLENRERNEYERLRRKFDG